VDIIVQRNAGDIRGDDIVDPLLSDINVALARGRSELDTHAVLQQPIQLTARFRVGVRLGQMIEVHDAMQGVAWRGKVSGISHKYDGRKVITVLDVLRPALFF
jgi:hypothetical protein